MQCFAVKMLDKLISRQLHTASTIQCCLLSTSSFFLHNLTPGMETGIVQLTLVAAVIWLFTSHNTMPMCTMYFTMLAVIMSNIFSWCNTVLLKPFFFIVVLWICQYLDNKLISFRNSIHSDFFRETSISSLEVLPGSAKCKWAWCSPKYLFRNVSFGRSLPMQLLKKRFQNINRFVTGRIWHISNLICRHMARLYLKY